MIAKIGRHYSLERLINKSKFREITVILCVPLERKLKLKQSKHKKYFLI